MPIHYFAMSLERKLEVSPKPEIAKSLWEKQKDNIRTVVIALILAFLLRTFVVEPRFIPSGSMEPTLLVNDRIIVEKISYLFNEPKRGQIIVFYPPKSPAIEDNTKAYIKRVIGLPGDRISIFNGKVFVNNNPLQEPYIAEPPNYVLPPQKQNLESLSDNAREQAVIIVPPNYYWVMGDNRNNSNDSHIWGFLPKQNIIVRAYLRFWPFDDRLGELKIPKY